MSGVNFNSAWNGNFHSSSDYASGRVVLEKSGSCTSCTVGFTASSGQGINEPTISIGGFKCVDLDEKCAGLPDGVYVDPSASNCESYLICMGDGTQSSIAMCPEDTYFVPNVLGSGTCEPDAINCNPTHVVQAFDEGGVFAFEPSVLNIELGDTVQWISTRGFHNAQGISDSYTGEAYMNPAQFYFDPVSAAGLIGTRTFDIPGIYNYDCSVGNHAALGMRGQIIVTDPTAYPLPQAASTCCGDLSSPLWAFNHPDTSAVCGTSLSDVCPIGDFYTTYDTCSAAGGRMCFLSDVLAAKNTGCSVNGKTVWTQEPCTIPGTGEPGYMTVDKPGNNPAFWITTCESPNDPNLSYNIRCCADVCSPPPFPPPPSPPAPPPPASTPSGCGSAEVEYYPFWGGFTLSASNLGSSGSVGNMLTFQFPADYDISNLQITVGQGNPWNCNIVNINTAEKYMDLEVINNNSWSCGLVAYIPNPQPDSVQLRVNGTPC